MPNAVLESFRRGVSQQTLLRDNAPVLSQPTILILMGVTGSGKTTLGRLFAENVGWKYFDADDFHSAANKEKMSKGIGLTDADRTPWLEALRVNCISPERKNALGCFTAST